MGAVSAAATPATNKGTRNTHVSAIAPRYTHFVAMHTRDSVQSDKLVERSETIQKRFQQLLHHFFSFFLSFLGAENPSSSLDYKWIICGRFLSFLRRCLSFLSFFFGG